MAVITNLQKTSIKPSQVFGYEAYSLEGYTRETFTVTVPQGQEVRVGSILTLDYVTKTATVTEAPATVEAVQALGEVGVFVGRDLPTNPATAQDFDNLSMTETGEAVLIVKGDGRGTLKKGYLDLAGSQYYGLPDAVLKAFDAKFTLENRFKMVEQNYTPKV